MTARQGRHALPIADGINFTIYLSLRIRDDPIYLHDRDVADYHAARRADGLWFYFGLFDRTGRNKNINSSLPYPSLFSLCPLCSLVERSKTGGEYKLVADQWTSSISSLPSGATYCGRPEMVRSTLHIQAGGNLSFKKNIWMLPCNV